VEHNFAGGMKMEFLHEVVAVGFGGFDAATELNGDLTRGFALGDQAQDFPLAQGKHRGGIEGGRGKVVVEYVLHLGGEESAMVFESLNRVDQVESCIRFEDEAASAGAEDLANEALGIIDGEDENALFVVVLENFTSSVETVEHGHAN